ncbi:hypothetical protein [Candidatus Burkholderia verschuerenii]|uniref:hypothetical protein n=1 Tax=Candidatus Burkholderia verschuerenii TaxID=242163 RepID=UPI00067ACDC0|nr:hypothetical protein [Candidatus Burkholderia verschuerenii]
MKAILRLSLAALLTIPVFLVLTRLYFIAGFLYSDAGFALLHPLFRLFGVFGVEGEESVVAGVMLVLSFIAAAALVWLSVGLLARVKAHRTAPH